MNEVRSGLHQIDVRIFYVGGGAILGAHLFTRIHRLLANVNLCFLYSHLSTENAVLGKNGATVLFKGRARIDYNKHGRPTHAVVWQSGPLAGLILVLTELVKATLQGVRRSRGSAVRQVAPLQKTQVLRMVRGLHGFRGLRDTALLLIGFASALRRSELVSLNVEDVQFTGEGTIIRLQRSKTDQEGRGRDIAIPRVRGRSCPSKSLQAWIQASGIVDGALFRRVNRYDQLLPQRLTPQSVALIIKQRAELAGFDAKVLSGHSLRAGFVTNAAKGGASSSSIRVQTGHKSDAMLQRYIRNSQLFSNNPNLKIW